MEQLKNHLKKAYDHLSVLPVSGDGVDVVALTRAELRLAWGEAEKLDRQEASNRSEMEEQEGG